MYTVAKCYEKDRYKIAGRGDVLLVHVLDERQGTVAPGMLLTFLHGGQEYHLRIQGVERMGNRPDIGLLLGSRLSQYEKQHLEWEVGDVLIIKATPVCDVCGTRTKFVAGTLPTKSGDVGVADGYKCPTCGRRRV